MVRMGQRRSDCGAMVSRETKIAELPLLPVRVSARLFGLDFPASLAQGLIFLLCEWTLGAEEGGMFS